jgi:hypothetical protein
MHKTKRTKKYSKKTQRKKQQIEKPQTEKPRHRKTMKSYDCRKGMTDESNRYLKYIQFFKSNKQVSLSNDR